MRAGLLVIGTALLLFVSGLHSAPDFQERIPLSAEQKKFISDHSPIRVGITPEWAPYSYFVDGEGRGIDMDVLQIISDRTGLKFELVPGAPPWDEIWSMAQKGELDVTTSTVQIKAREEVFRFTRPYGKSSSVIISRGGDLRFRHLTLLKEAVMAQPRNHYVSMVLSNYLAPTNFLWFDTQGECFEAVRTDKADAAVADLFTATQYMNDHPEVKLWISGVIPDYEFPLRLAVRRDYEVLAQILDEGLATIPQEELDAITSKHLLFTLHGGQRLALFKRRIAYTILGAIVFAAIFIVWNCLIRKEMLARRAAEAELRETNQSLEVFSHSIAHDLRTPLRAITGLSEALQQDYGEKLGKEGEDYINRITSAALRMESLVRDVLAYTQASRGEFKVENVSLKQVIHELLGEFPPAQRGCFHVDSELPTVRAHAALLGQCISNLLSNAIKFIPAGRAPEIRVWAEQNDGRVRLWVQDNGIGIAAQDQERIFKVFQRGSHSYGGTGIGLAVVAKGMERMGGRTGVESEVNRGSRFWVELPLGDLNRAQSVANPEFKEKLA